MVLAFNHRKFIDIKSQQYCYDLCDKADDSDPTLCLSPCVDNCKDKCSDFDYFYSPPPPPTSLHHSHKPREFVTISVTLIAVALLAIALYIVYIKWKASRQRRRSGPQINQTHDDFVDEDHGPVVDHHVWYIQTVGLQPAVINAISVCKFKKGDGLVEGTECSVCLSEFQEDETLRLLPKCSHAFHIPCIDTWLRSHTNCPMCRAPIVRNIGSSSSSTSAAAVVAESSSSSSSANESGDTQMEVSEENGLGDEVVERNEEVEEEEIVEMQPMRRSVSVDSLSAMKISQALVVSSDESSREPKRVNSSRTDSLARFVASASIRRSLSCSGKLFLSRSMRIDRI